jgi:predicted Zn-dependent protease
MTVVRSPIRTRRFTPAFRALSVCSAIAVTAASLPQTAAAQGRMPLIRDTEIEQLLRDYTQPILKTAGLANQNVKIVIINDRNFNAFVMDGKRIFVNTGALTESQTPNQLIGVLAHETGHIAGGHLSRLRDELANAQTMAIIAMLLGMGAMVAGGRGDSGAGQAGAAAIAGAQQIAQRTVLSYQRSQEEQADRAAVKFLNATGQSAKGMYETFRRFADQIMFTARQVDPYAQSHPMPAERVAALAEIARSNRYWDKKDSPDLQLRHDMMRAKISGFLEPPATVMRRYPQNDNSLPARYARAITTYKHGDLQSAVRQIDALIAAQPNNPYFYELKGQALLESGRGQEAVAPLRRAVQMLPNAPLIQIMLGQALVSTNNPAHADEAVAMLRNSLAREPEAPAGYQQLAMAYGRKGDLAQADLASAQAAFYRGDLKTARELAARAKARFPVGTPGWVRADDIASTKMPESAQMRRR